MKCHELGILILCYALALLPPFLAELWHDYSGVYYLYASRWTYIFNTSLLILLFALFLACLTHYAGRFRRFLFVLLMLALSFLGTVNLVHVALYDAPISVGAVDALLGTDLHEAIEYLTFHWTKGVMLALAIYGVGCLVIVVGMWRMLGLPRRCGRRDHVWAWPALLALAVVVYRFPGIAFYHVEAFQKKPLWSRLSELNRQV
ncbi:MAG TPA: hypothetical protein VFW62_02385, partial [bacterium]|nr:hypothetical protein [bacterium]